MLLLLAPASADDYTPIILPGNQAGKIGSAKLILFVPGGKVPPQDYTPFVQGVLDRSSANLFGAIVHCGKLNLCDPLGQLDGLIASAIQAAGKMNNNKPFSASDIFVFGHSLGGVGARHYVDTQNGGPASFKGLALLGTQYNGDHEDFKGTLGYPANLTAFPSPLLAILGELDMVPTSHAAKLYESYLQIEGYASRAAKPVLVVPRMDHSQFCSPFNVSGDLDPELSNSEALETVTTLAAAWVDNILVPSQARAQQAQNLLVGFAANHTESITAAWRAASKMEAQEVCINAQHTIISTLPADIRAKVKSENMVVIKPDSSPNLEHGHTNCSLDADGNVHVTIVSYPYYPQVKSWNPVDLLAPTYSSARDISCKLVSADRIAQVLNVTGQYPQKNPPVPCSAVNAASFETATSLLMKYHPDAVSRAQRRGRSHTLQTDSSTIAGPQWVFLTSLKFAEGSSSSTAPAQIQSPRLYSSIASSIYPGNMYCKVLSPAKAIEWIQTTGITGRFK